MMTSAPTTTWAWRCVKLAHPAGGVKLTVNVHVPAGDSALVQVLLVTENPLPPPLTVGVSDAPVPLFVTVNVVGVKLSIPKE
jgi:hypothetical protein